MVRRFLLFFRKVSNKIGKKEKLTIHLGHTVIQIMNKYYSLTLNLTRLTRDKKNKHTAHYRYKVRLFIDIFQGWGVQWGGNILMEFY